MKTNRWCTRLAFTSRFLLLNPWRCLMRVSRRWTTRPTALLPKRRRTWLLTLTSSGASATLAVTTWQPAAVTFPRPRCCWSVNSLTVYVLKLAVWMWKTSWPTPAAVWPWKSAMRWTQVLRAQKMKSVRRLPMTRLLKRRSVLKQKRTVRFRWSTRTVWRRWVLKSSTFVLSRSTCLLKCLKRSTTVCAPSVKR